MDLDSDDIYFPEFLNADENLIHGKQYSYSYSARPTSFNTSEAIKLTLHCWCAYMNKDDYGEFKTTEDEHDGIFSEGITKSLENGFREIIEPQNLISFVNDEETDTQAYVCENCDREENKSDSASETPKALEPPVVFESDPKVVTKKKKKVAWADQAFESARRKSSIRNIKSERKVITVACRGTTNFKDWITNMTIVKTKFNPIEDLHVKERCCGPHIFGLGREPLVHMGFYNAFLSIAHVVKDEIIPRVLDKKVEEINFVGHSLGGALANLLFAFFLQLVNVDLLVKSEVKVSFFTIGQPRVGNNVFVKMLEDLGAPLKKAKLLKTFRMICNLDLVPAVPIFSLGFRHFGKPALIHAVNDNDMKLLFGIKPEHKDADDENSNICNSCLICSTACCVEQKPWKNTRFEAWLTSPKDLIQNHSPKEYYQKCKFVDREYKRPEH